MRRPTSAGKGGGILQQRGFVLAREYKGRVLHLGNTLFLNRPWRASPAGFGVEEGAGGRAKGRRRNRSQFQWAPGFPCAAPHGQAGEEGRDHTDAFWIFNFHSRVRLLFLPDSFFIFPLTPQVTTEVVMFPVF